jgi:hypothetical protein
MQARNDIDGGQQVSSSVLEGGGTFSKKFTYEEYKEEMEQYREGKIPKPDPEDIQDPLYYRKYAHTLPPLECHFHIPDNHELQCKNMKSNNERKIFYGWNNLTKFEEQGIVNLKKRLEEKGITLPPGYDDRDYMKFCQASFYDIEKSSLKIIEHFKWL